MRPQDWAFFAALAAAVTVVVAAIRGDALAAVAGCGVTATLMWASHALSRRYHGPMPAWGRWGLLWPRHVLGPGPLARLLAPTPGERIFELGPGIGVHALPIAAALSPAGSLSVLDVQPLMLDHLARRAARAGVHNIEATIANGRVLPYEPASFDGAYLIDVLGEMPDARGALLELHRILKPGGRLVVGEYFVDPDFVSFGSLVTMAHDAGFSLEGRRGIRLMYLARFVAQSANACRPGPVTGRGPASTPAARSAAAAAPVDRSSGARC